jgi:two-component system sensor histidine kinase/response regulator
MVLSRKYKVRLSTARNGQEAIEKIRNCQEDCMYDIIFMDCNMPIMDGYEASK